VVVEAVHLVPNADFYAVGVGAYGHAPHLHVTAASHLIDFVHREAANLALNAHALIHHLAPFLMDQWPVLLLACMQVADAPPMHTFDASAPRGFREIRCFVTFVTGEAVQLAGAHGTLVWSREVASMTWELCKTDSRFLGETSSGLDSRHPRHWCCFGEGNG